MTRSLRFQWRIVWISRSLPRSFKVIFGSSAADLHTIPSCSAHQDHKLQREKGNPISVCLNAIASTSSSNGPRFREILRILFPSLFSTQNVRRMETSFGSETVKQIHSRGILQDGIPNMVILSVQPGDRMVSKDLQDASLHIPVHQIFQSFLQFKVGELHLQFRCLPFGISTAPKTFTKVLVTILAPLQEKGIWVLHYLDDILIPRQESSANTLERICKHIDQIRVADKFSKSQLIPSQRMTYLGALFDTPERAVSLPPEKIPMLLGKVKSAMAAGPCQQPTA